MIAIFSAMNILAGANIDIYGHLGGLVTGVPLGFLLLRGESMAEDSRLDKFRAPSRLFLIILIPVSTALMFVKPLPGCDDNACANVCQA